jgi:hypothetical protein
MGIEKCKRFEWEGKGRRKSSSRMIRVKGKEGEER